MVDFFLSKKVLVKLLTIFVVLAGLMMITKIKRATYPNVEFDIFKITTVYPGASARDVEIHVTKKIEDEIKSVRDIDRVRSFSIENLSVVYVWIDLTASDSDEVKQDLRRAVDRVVDLPIEVDQKPVVDEIKSSNVVLCASPLPNETAYSQS